MTTEPAPSEWQETNAGERLHDDSIVQVWESEQV